MPRMDKQPFTEAVDELRRCYVITRDTRKLIELSRVPAVDRTDDWAAKREKLQDKIEKMADAQMNKHLEQLGKQLAHMVDHGGVFAINSEKK